MCIWLLWSFYTRRKRNYNRIDESLYACSLRLWLHPLQVQKFSPFDKSNVKPIKPLNCKVFTQSFWQEMTNKSFAVKFSFAFSFFENFRILRQSVMSSLIYKSKISKMHLRRQTNNSVVAFSVSESDFVLMILPLSFFYMFPTFCCFFWTLLKIYSPLDHTHIYTYACRCGVPMNL